MDDEFVIIPEFPNYEINRNGVVRNVKNLKELKHSYYHTCWATVRLFKSNHPYERSVRELVLLIFGEDNIDLYNPLEHKELIPEESYYRNLL